MKKKQEDVKTKYGGGKTFDDDDDGDEKSLKSDDSDLASLAREFAKEEIQDSPFLKRKTSETGISLSSKPGSATPLPEQDAPFVNSLVRAQREAASSKPKQTSSALSSFMKFNAKYDAKIQIQNNPPEESETEPESDVKKIASELEEKIRPGRRMSKEEKRSRRASLAAEKSLNPVEERPVSRLRKQAEERKLKLHIPERSRKISNESGGGTSGAPTPTPMFTASEMSDLPIHTASSKSYMVEDILGPGDGVKKEDPGAEATEEDEDNNTIVEDKPTTAVVVQTRDQETITEESIVNEVTEKPPPIREEPKPSPPSSHNVQAPQKISSPSPPPQAPSRIPPQPLPQKEKDLPQPEPNPEPKSDQKKKKKKDKRKPKKEIEQETEETEYESPPRRRKKKSRHRYARSEEESRRSTSRRRHSHSQSSGRSQSCVACVDLCTFHLAQAKSMYFSGGGAKASSSRLRRPTNHYLFDPRQDLLFPDNRLIQDNEQDQNMFRKYI